MNKNIIWIALVIIALLGLIFFLMNNKEVNHQLLAKDWIVNNSSTYIFDGSNLTFLTIEAEKYYFSFESSHGGYGDRSQEMVTQVITTHIIEIAVENNKVVSAITDGKYDEINKKSIAPVFEGETVSIFFLNIGSEQEELVKKERKIPVVSGKSFPQLAIEELLKGPSAEESENGIFSMINPGTMLYSLTLEDGVATVDFNQKLQENIAGSATVMAIRNQIEKTLLQFEYIEEVVISIDGETEEILQP